MIFQTTTQKRSKEIAPSIVTLSYFIVVFHSSCLFTWLFHSILKKHARLQAAWLSSGWGENAMRDRSAANPSRFTRCACLFSKSRKIKDCSYSILGDQGAVTWVGKNGGEFFKNGCERPWDATLNKPVPWLIRMLASDWAQKILSEASIDRAVSLIFL